MSQTHAIFASRRAFGRSTARFDAWFSAQEAPAADEIWETFGREVLAAFLAQSATIWSCGVHPQARARLAFLLCEAARAKMQLDGCGGDYNFDPHEGQIWDAALRVSRRAVEIWEAEIWRKRGEFGGIYGGASHRLADLYRRAGRTDERALRLYIAVFTGSRAAPMARVGAGAQISVDALLQRGAAISDSSAPDEIAARYSLCLLLRNRGYGATWLPRSLQIARANSPQTGELLQKRLGLTAARDFQKTQAPTIAVLAAILRQIAQISEAREAATAQAELQKRAEQAQIKRELQESARAKAAAAKKSNSKTKRKRKAAPNDTPIALPPKSVSKAQLEFDTLFDETFKLEPLKATPKPAPSKPAPSDDWDDFLAEFESALE